MRYFHKLHDTSPPQLMPSTASLNMAFLPSQASSDLPSPPPDLDPKSLQGINGEVRICQLADEAFAPVDAASVLSMDRSALEGAEDGTLVQYVMALQDSQRKSDARLDLLESLLKAANEEAARLPAQVEYLKLHVAEKVRGLMKPELSTLDPQEWWYVAKVPSDAIPSVAVLYTLFHVPAGELRDGNQWETTIPLEDFVLMIGATMEVEVDDRIKIEIMGQPVSIFLKLTGSVYMEWDGDDKHFAISGEYVYDY